MDGALLIAGLIGTLFGLAIIALGWKGFGKEGIPLTKNRRIKGRAGQVIGAIVVLAGFGTLSKGVAYFVTAANMAMSLPSQQRMSESRMKEISDRGVLTQMQLVWDTLTEEKKSNLAQSVAESRQLNTPDPVQLTETNRDFKIAVFYKLQSRLRAHEREQIDEQIRQMDDYLKSLRENLNQQLTVAKARVDKVKPELKKIEFEVLIFLSGEGPPPIELLERAAVVYKEAILAYAEIDNARARQIYNSAFEFLKKGIDDSPGGTEGKSRLVQFSVATLSEIGGAEALPMLTEARRFAIDLIAEDDTVARRSDASNLALYSAFANSSAGNAPETVVADFRDVLQHSVEAYTIAMQAENPRRQSFARNLISYTYNCLARHYESENDWSSVARIAEESLEFAGDDAGALLNTSVQFAIAGRNITDRQRRSVLLGKAKETLQRAIDSGLTYEQVVESSHKQQVIASQPGLLQIIEPLVSKANSAGDEGK